MRTYPLLLLFLFAACNSRPSTQNLIDDSAVTQLLALMDSIAERNAGNASTISQIDSLSRSDREKAILASRERNMHDHGLQAMIDNLLESEPYEIYFARFRNVTPADFRLAFVSLPHAVPDLPGGVGEAFYELFHNRAAFQSWYMTARGGVDIQRCVTAAKEWLPPGDHPLNKVYFIYDGNAGSFAEQGNAFFNLCSEVVSKVPGEKGFEHLEEANIARLEGVIAHELNHVMAEPILYPRGLTFTSWEEQWKDRITRAIVSEGVAFRCNPLTGFQKTLWEDHEILSSLMSELNKTLIALDAHTKGEDAVREWYGRLFQEFAQSLLRQYLQRTEPDANPDDLARERAIFRPDLVHTLGWWMVSRVTDDGANREMALKLLANPSSLYGMYNATLAAGMNDIAVDGRVIKMFSGHQGVMN